MKPLRPYLPWIAVSGVVLFALGNGVTLLARSLIKLSAGSAGRDEVSMLERRLHPLRGVIPPTETVGYVDDLGSGVESRRVYALAGYILSPVLLEEGAERSLVVGVFRDPAHSMAMLPEKGLIPLRDFGQGVVLLKRTGK